MNEPDVTAQLHRRRLLLGAGAGALAAASLSDLAQAKPTAVPTPPPLRQRLRAPGDGTTAAAQRSNPLSGYTYRAVSFADFHPVEKDNWREVAAIGFRSTAGLMYATVEIPAGAIAKDVEFYYLNPNASVELAVGIWQPGVFDIDYWVIENANASSGNKVRRLVIPSEFQVAREPGSRLLLAFISSGTPQAEIVGARVGFSGGGVVSLRDTPVRVYDSRTAAAGILEAKETRTLAVPVAVAPTGTSGLVVNLTAIYATGVGFLTVWGAHVLNRPPTSSINFTAADPVANCLLVGISANRLIKVYANPGTHVVVDVLGTVS